MSQDRDETRQIFSNFVKQLLQNEVVINGQKVNEFNNLYHALQRQPRPFEMRVHSEDAKKTETSKIFQNRLERDKNEAKEFMERFKLPLPSDESERRKVINEAVSHYSFIGANIINQLIVALRQERGELTSPGDEEIYNQAVKAARNYMFILPPPNLDPSKAEFFKQIAIAYTAENPVLAFENQMKDALLGPKCNSVKTIALYMNMESETQFIKLLNENPEIKKKCSEIIMRDSQGMRKKGDIQAEIQQLKIDKLKLKAEQLTGKYVGKQTDDIKQKMKNVSIDMTHKKKELKVLGDFEKLRNAVVADRASQRKSYQGSESHIRRFVTTFKTSIGLDQNKNADQKKPRGPGR